ncbi:MAG TPA: SDR family NAD(P)-dependent oxidoreductase [Candidatus Scatomorpha intestinavium]|uniref:SDR family NAD(P)-dependent oxidoreductase n=1 Tax=Candidatus Scatomorpha intestinavium TaxID=2840922 RepID=A0A9D0ZDN5_9FIRM|nr:SDR family NAD(P)-dependent oxidoreductase [Candidatus Scatomorpha intestinavium]
MSENSAFEGKVAVITGGGGTLCSCIAKHLAAAGAKVAVIGRTMGKLEAVVNEITAAGGVCIAKTGDVSNEESMQRAAEEIKSELGPCGILVNGAGGNNPKAITTNAAFTPEELDSEAFGDKIGFFNVNMDYFRSVIDINVVGTVICSRVFGRQMAESGGGAILNFASMNSYRPLSCRPAYALSKAAIVNFTQWLASYLAPAGIRVNAVAPGFITNANNIRFYGSLETGYTPRGMNILAHTPMGRFGRADELLGVVDLLLDGGRAGFVTGVTVPVDGGFLSCSGL